MWQLLQSESVGRAQLQLPEALQAFAERAGLSPLQDLRIASGERTVHQSQTICVHLCQVRRSTLLHDTPMQARALSVPYHPESVCCVKFEYNDAATISLLDSCKQTHRLRSQTS